MIYDYYHYQVLSIKNDTMFKLSDPLFRTFFLRTSMSIFPEPFSSSYFMAISVKYSWSYFYYWSNSLFRLLPIINEISYLLKTPSSL